MIRYKFQYLVGPSGKYSSTIVREFFASFTATILNSLLKGKNPLTQHQLKYTWVRGRQVDNSETTISRILFGPDFPMPKSTIEFVRRLGQTRDTALMRDLDRSTSLMRWVADQITEYGLDLEWIATLSEPIMKASPSFTSKF